MGKYDDAMYRYLSDNDRFADLFNAVLFGGRAVLRGEDLESHAERSVDVRLPEAKGISTLVPEFRNGVRDIVKRSGSKAGFLVWELKTRILWIMRCHTGFCNIICQIIGSRWKASKNKKKKSCEIRVFL